MNGVRQTVVRWYMRVTRNLRLASIARTTLIGTVPFIGGLVVSKLYDRLTDPPSIAISRPVTLIALSAMVCLILSGFAIIAVFIETLREIEKLRLDLAVEFVSDGPGDDHGLTYERTRQLIETARESLVFLDYWVEPRRNGADPSGSVASERRRAYYDAIVAKVTARMQDGRGVFHRRVVQLPGWGNGEGWLETIQNDAVYVEHLKACRTLQAKHRSTQIKGAAPYIHTHFAIVDSRYVVWPILRADPENGGLTRQGAIFIEDRNRQLVRKLMELFEKIDGDATPLHLKDSH
jgi:hypothetical protein